jgi:hypothetical protein
MSSTAETSTDGPPTAPDREAIRAFLGRALADDALDDEVKQLLFDHVVEERLDRTTLIARLAREVAGLIDAATPEDWEAVADGLIAEAREVEAALRDDDGEATGRPENDEDGEFRVTLHALGSHRDGWALSPRLEAFGDGNGALRLAIDAGLLEALGPVAGREEFARRLLALGILDRSDNPLPGAAEEG